MVERRREREADLSDDLREAVEGLLRRSPRGERRFAKDDLLEDLGRTPSPGSTLPRLTPDGRTCAPDWSWACRVDLLKQNVEQYPYLQFASWSDSAPSTRTVSCS